MATFETTRKPRKRKQETSEPTYETPVMSNKLLPLNSTTKAKRESIADLRKLSPTPTLKILKKPSSDRSTSTIKILEKKPSSSRSTSTIKILEKKPSSNRSTSTIKILEQKPSSNRSTSTIKILEKKPPSNRSTSTSENRENVSKDRWVIRVSRQHRRSISPPLTSLLCRICTDEKLKDDMFTIAGCDHSYCSDCVAKYVASKFQGNVVNITCPAPGCKSSLDPQKCQSILPKQVFDRWCDVLCESLIVGSEKLYCPFKDCSALLIDARYDNEDVPECECPECHRLFCGECKVPWHASLTCKEYQKTLSKDESSSKDNEDMKLIKLAKRKRWMRCPNCRYYVKRSGGCLFIKCRCGHGFCYNCGASMDDHYCKKCKH